MNKYFSRRTFLGGGAGVLSLAAAGARPLAAADSDAAPAPRGPNDRVTVGMIAVGSRAHELIEALKKIEGAEIVAVCDAYSGRAQRAVDRTDGRARIVSDYRAILDDKSIDVVTVASPDHWHKDHVVESLRAGKDVYCEKPLTYTIDEGEDILDAVKETGRLLQVGSQGMSTETQVKARDMIRSGRLGKITMVRASYNRNTASGAWIYPIPPDASPDTVNWEMFLGPAKKRPFDLERFFRWRCYQDYSGGIATDLFVHLCTSIHFMMDAKMPSSVVAMGELYRWRESRNVPDTLNAIMEYPEGFTVNLSSTFNNQSGSEGRFQFLGTEGALDIGFRGFTFIPENVREGNGWIVNAWPRDLEEQYNRDLKAQEAETLAGGQPPAAKATEEFKDKGPNANIVHLSNFIESVRTRTPPIEDALFGHRAAACAHLINDSVEKKKMTHWDFRRERQRG